MALGTPKTRQFRIGTFEVRIGPMSKAGKLDPSHSIGLVDQVTLNIEQTSVDLMGGFPQRIVDTALTSQAANISATLREYSRRNMNVLLGNAVQDYDSTDVKSVVDTTSALAAEDTSVSVATGEGSNFTEGDIVVIFEVGKPESVTVSRIASIAADTLTLETDLGLVVGFAQNSIVHIHKAPAVAIGGLSTVNYFAVQLLQVERGTSRPMGFNFWKAAIGGNISVGATPTEFASTEMSLKLLEPAASEYAPGADLEHLADIIPTYPIGMMFTSSDAA